MKTNKQVEALTAELKEQGWNDTQAKSLAWSEFFEEKMNEYNAKSKSFFGGTIRIDCYCYDCKIGGHLLPETTRIFIHSHKNHNTKTFARK